MIVTDTPRRWRAWMRAALATATANLVLAGIAATTALARGGSGSHSFSGGSHSSFHSTGGHLIYHHGHYYSSFGGGGSHIGGAAVAAILLGSFALAALIPLTIWLVRRHRAAT